MFEMAFSSRMAVQLYSVPGRGSARKKVNTGAAVVIKGWSDIPSIQDVGSPCGALLIMCHHLRTQWSSWVCFEVVWTALHDFSEINVLCTGCS
jgi:hypothetical protein